MPSPTTALQLITDGLALTNSVGADQTLTADEGAMGLRVFNDLLEIFNTNNLAVYSLADQTFNTVAAQATYTVGTGGNWNTVRPVRVADLAYTVISTVSYPCTSITAEEYNIIPIKSQQQQFPYRFLFENTFPLSRITLWPVPSGVVPMTFSFDNQLTAATALGTAISFPPGYAMVFVYKLAIMLAPRFGKKITQYPEIVAIANDSFASICRANKKLRVMQFDPAYTSGGVQTLQSFIGGYY